MTSLISFLGSESLLSVSAMLQLGASLVLDYSLFGAGICGIASLPESEITPLLT